MIATVPPRTAGEIRVGLCTFAYNRSHRWSRTTFPTGKYTEKFSIIGESDATLDQYQGWGYERSDDGVAQGLIEHEYAHSLTITTLLGLPWSPELFSQAHGFITGYKSSIPDGLKPFLTYSIPLEESIAIATVIYIRAGKRHAGWKNAAFPDTDPLDYIAERTDLDAFLAKMRARLDGLWE